MARQESYQLSTSPIYIFRGLTIPSTEDGKRIPVNIPVRAKYIQSRNVDGILAHEFNIVDGPKLLRGTFLARENELILSGKFIHYISQGGRA